MQQGCDKLTFNSLSGVLNCPHGHISWVLDESDPENTKAQVECSADQCSSEIDARKAAMRRDPSFSDELIGLGEAAQAVQNNIQALAANVKDDFPKINEDEFNKAKDCEAGHLSLEIPPGDEPWIKVKCSAAGRAFDFGTLSLLMVVIASCGFHLL
ncbi:hypothetical protein RBB50_004650 [Rhinocladiella similis]